MFVIGDTIISEDIADCCFSCDLSECRGACCIQGDSGAPLEKHEARILKKIYKKIRPFLRQEGIEVIEKIGTSTVDFENDTVTPLVNNRECAYTIFENDMAYCGIEKAFLNGAVKFRKPSSCHLYPVRIKKYHNYDAVNYDRWEICKPAVTKGTKENIPLYSFSKTALIDKYGTEWYKILLKAIIERRTQDKK